MERIGTPVISGLDALIRRMSAKKLCQSIHDYAGDEARFYRQGSFPTADKAMLYGTLLPGEGILELKSMAAEVSQSCALGYTYGIAVLKTGVLKERAEAYSAHLHI